MTTEIHVDLTPILRRHAKALTIIGTALVLVQILVHRAAERLEEAATEIDELTERLAAAETAE